MHTSDLHLRERLAGCGDARALREIDAINDTADRCSVLALSGSVHHRHLRVILLRVASVSLKLLCAPLHRYCPIHRAKRETRQNSSRRAFSDQITDSDWDCGIIESYRRINNRLIRFRFLGGGRRKPEPFRLRYFLITVTIAA